MAITVDSVGTLNNSTAVTNPSNTFSNVAGNFLAVGFAYSKGSTVTAATYGGVAMTFASKVTMTGWVYDVATYYLASPPTGSNTVNFTLNTSTQATLIQPISYSGVDTINPVDSTGSNYITTAGAQTSTLTLTPTTSTGWLFAMFNSGNSGTIAGGTNTTIIANGNTQTGTCHTNGTIGSGSQTLNIVWGALSGGGEGAALVGFSFKEKPTTSPSFINFM